MKVLGSEQTDEIAEILKNDGVAAIATDTVYGVCARMDSMQAQQNLRDVKHRPLTKAFPLMCSDRAQSESIAVVDETAGRIIDALMPGPITVVLKKKDTVPAFVNGGMDTLAIRMASSPLLYTVIRKTGCPLYMTSANRSGEPECRTLDEIIQACPALDAVVDSMPGYGRASTIVDCSGAEPRILREGPITIEQILKLSGRR